MPNVAPARERGLKLKKDYLTAVELKVAPARERGLKSLRPTDGENPCEVAPARERGLKFVLNILLSEVIQSLPQGSVD